MQTNDEEVPTRDSNREEARAHLARQIGRLLAIAWLKDLEARDDDKQQDDAAFKPTA